MKMLLRTGVVFFFTTAFLDPLWSTGLGNPVHWLRDIAMAVAGAICLYLLVRFRNAL